jgi:hypothetical protein
LKCKCANEISSNVDDDDVDDFLLVLLACCVVTGLATTAVLFCRVTIVLLCLAGAARAGATVGGASVRGSGSGLPLR